MDQEQALDEIRRAAAALADALDKLPSLRFDVRHVQQDVTGMADRESQYRHRIVISYEREVCR